METYVEGYLGDNMLSEATRLIAQIEPLGYEFKEDGLSFVKTGRIEAVVNELLPICDSLGLDVDDLSLVEYRKNDRSVRSTFEQGEIDRD